MPEPVFDTPQWTFQIPPEGTEESIALLPVKVYGRKQQCLGTAKVIAPSELFKYLRDVCKLESLGNLCIELEQEKERYYLVLSPQEDHDIDLWYYTKSNLPVWAGRVYGT